MDLNLKLFSWNASCITSSSSYLSDKLNAYNIDICGISEHWLFERDLHFLGRVNPLYSYHAVADKTQSSLDTRKVGKGGVALLWKKSYDKVVSRIPSFNDRIVGIQIETSQHRPMFIFQVYLPSKNNPAQLFCSYLECLINTYDEYISKGTVILMGDMNCHINCKNERGALDARDKNFLNFLRTSNLVSICTLENCTGPRSTYDCSTGRSTVDHIIIPNDDLDMITSCEVIDDDALCVSDHRPLLCVINIPCYEVPSGVAPTNRIKWSKLPTESKQAYSLSLNNDVGLRFAESMSLSNTADIDHLYQIIVSAMKNTAEHFLPKKRFKSHLKPYWCDSLNNLHKNMLHCRVIWLNEGRPRNGLTFMKYKDSKRVFRNAHRKAIDYYLSQLHNEIDEAAEVDQDKFWYLVNQKKYGLNNAAVSEMIFNGVACRDSSSILNGWQSYFTDLYSVDQNPNYDHSFASSVSDFLAQQDASNHSYDSGLSGHQFCVTPEIIKRLLLKAKRNKAAGDDGINYEHMFYGGKIILSLLCKLFSAMLRLCHVPFNMKKGIIFTVFKGGTKNKKDPKSYRAITLTSSILKLFESVLLMRLETKEKLEPHPLQGGFRRGLGCMMTSLTLTECIYFAKENKSKLYVCFLDCQQAFDRVWHEGLFFKLFRKDIDQHTVSCIMSMYKDSRSVVRYNGLLSDPISILQGTRQGGVSSPSMYLLFIEDLIVELEESGYGFCMVGNQCSSLSVADDMALLSFSKCGLQAMINICYRYSLKWRFSYNASKCSVVVYNESKNVYKSQSRSWLLGQDLIHEGKNYNHLGVNVDKFMNFSDNVDAACRKLRSTLLGLINVGVHPNGLRTMTCFKIYKSVVIPKALYGCELWPALPDNKVLQVEQAHRFCIKHVLHVPAYSKTDVCMSIVGSRNIEYDIDMRKLTFFGQMCRLNANHVSQQVFRIRFQSFQNCNNTQMGFAHEIDRLLGKYSLKQYLTGYLENGVFPSKRIWRSILRRAINSTAERSWHERISACPNIRNFLSIKPVLQHPFELLYVGGLNDILNRSSNVFTFLICKLFSDSFTDQCTKCHLQVTSIVVHALCSCRHTVPQRTELYSVILSLCGVHTLSLFLNQEPRLRAISILSGLRNITNDDAKTHAFYRKAYKPLWLISIALQYKNIRSIHV